MTAEKMMELIRSRWNFEEHQYDAIENVLSDEECITAIRASAVGAGAREAIIKILNGARIYTPHADDIAPHIENRAALADAILASLQSEPVQPRGKCTCPYDGCAPCEFCLVSEPVQPAGKGLTEDALTMFLCEVQDRLGPGCDERAIAQALLSTYALPVRPEAPAGVRAETIEECRRIVQSEITNIDAGLGWGAWTDGEHLMMRNVAMKIGAAISALPSDPVRRTTQGESSIEPKELLRELFRWCLRCNDFRSDSSLGRRIAAYFDPPIQRDSGVREGCILCANGNDLPEGEQCAGCGREGHAVGLRAAVIKARGRSEPPTSPVQMSIKQAEWSCPVCGRLNTTEICPKCFTPIPSDPKSIQRDSMAKE